MLKYFEIVFIMNQFGTQFLFKLFISTNEYLILYI